MAMSSEGSVSSNGSRIRQFGLYRSIDARTEEFLRLSRRRQIRQGCACAAVSTAITVTVVVVILLIYEYTIAVEWSLVQRIRNGNGTYGDTNITHDTPFADRLDRSFFGFDQDYYERMPLLVNALQESNYVDPVIELSRPVSQRPYGKNGTIPRKFAPDAYRQSKIRKTSPRPFIYEYRTATPLPFSKTYGSRSWVDSYRNAQRLQNIRQVIRYLEKTINAKTGDMHTKPTNSHTSIAFSGVYVEPKIDKEKLEETNGMELQQQNSNRVETYANHNEDPLFNFKPDSPGEVNLLADTYFRFAPVPTPSILEDTKPSKVPMFRRIPYRKYCRGSHCDNSVQENIDNLKSSTEHNTELPTSTKSFSLMLNLYPMKPNASPEFKQPKKKDEGIKSSEKIYITTTKPLIQFRKKPSPMRRTYYRYKKPRYLTRNRNTSDLKSKVSEQKARSENNSTTMVVHVDVYSPDDKDGLRNQTLVQYRKSTIQPSTFRPITEKPIELFAGQVEDHHDGSSGLITVQIPENTETLQPVPTVVPFLDTTTSSTEVNPWATISATSPPDVFKFRAEDAKVPDHYLNMATTQTVPMNLDRYNMNSETTQVAPIETERRNMVLPTTQIEMERKYLDWETTQTMPTEIDTLYNWETTQSPMGMSRRRMNLVTTQSVPMETVHVNMDWTTTESPIEINTREINSETTTTDRGNMKWASTQTPKEIDRSGLHGVEKSSNNLRDTLIIKLRNGVFTTDRTYPTTTDEIEETTTMKTYVPQINGHYRSIIATKNQSRYSAETYRKRKLEMSVTGFRSYVPMYTEIRRNKTKPIDDSE